MAAAVLEVGREEQSPRANMFAYSGLMCCNVPLSTATQPAESAMGEDLIKSRGPIGGVTWSMV